MCSFVNRRLIRHGFVLTVSFLSCGIAVGQDRDHALSVAGRIEAPIYLDQVTQMRVSPHGVIEGGGAGPRDQCNAIASNTDANFGGGSFILEAGFAETEWLAASYTLAASA